MYFTRAKFYKITHINNEWRVILFASRKHYGNAIGVNRGVWQDKSNKSFIQLAKWVLTKHKRVKLK